MHDADDMCPDHYAWSLIGSKAPSRPELAMAVLQKLICAPVRSARMRCLTMTSHVQQCGVYTNLSMK